MQFRFLKNSQVQINSKLNSKQYDYLYILVFLARDRYGLIIELVYENANKYHT